MEDPDWIVIGRAGVTRMTEPQIWYRGSAAELYEHLLVPLIFSPHARILASRLAGISTGDLLEIAAGTGALTRELCKVMPATVRIVASDLNQPMLDQAMTVADARRVTWRQADAMSLPFGDRSFDAAVCQFGVMFFPDKVTAYREALRVLKPGGRFLFSVWDKLETNVLNQMYQDILERMFPSDAPGRMRVPYSYHDTDSIERDLREAGFSDVGIEVVPEWYGSMSAREAAYALVQGHSVRVEIETRGPDYLDKAAEALAQAVADRFGEGPVKIPNRAMIVHVERPVWGH
jgi:ubiquinone/menaquinone biosynthesis C-methylase UbiE